MFLLIAGPIVYGQNAVSHYISAREFLKSDKIMLAKSELDSAIAIDPNYANAHYMLGEISKEERGYLKAIAHYDRAIESNPNFLEAYLKRADLHFKLNDHKEYIIRDIEKAITIKPDSAELFAIKAFYLSNTVDDQTFSPNYPMAITAISMAITLEPKNSAYYFFRSKYRFELSQTLPSLADINKAIEFSPDNAGYYAHRGFIRFMIDDFRASSGDYTRAINLEPANSKYFESRAYAKYNMGNYSSAYNDYSSAIDMLISKLTLRKGRIVHDDPLNMELRKTLLLRGMTLVQGNKPYDGCDDFERAYQMGEQKARNYIRRYCN